MSGGSVAFGHEDLGRELSDAEFLTHVRWLSATSNADLLQAVAAGRLDKFWRTWSKSVTTRVDRKQRQKRIANRSALWPWSDSREHPAKAVWTLIEKADWPKLSRWARQQLSNSDAWSDVNTPFQLLALADVLLSGELVDVDIALPVWRLALTWAIELSLHQSGPEGCELSPERRLLLCGELPWVLGQIFAGVEGVAEFKELGQQSLRNELIELTDGDGTPAVSLLAHFPQWLSSLTRSVEVGGIFSESLLDGESLLRFEDVLTKAVMLLDRDGNMLISTDGRSLTSKRNESTASIATPTVAMLLRASELVGLNETSLAAESLRFREFVARHGSSDKFKSDTFAESPDERPIVTDSDLPALQSDWADWACMRNWWHSDANTAIVVHNSPKVELEISLFGVPVFGGEWELSVQLDGKPLAIDQDWKCICWTSDPDMDYMELQIEWPEGPMLCRQVMLSRKDHFLVIADAVSRAGGQRVDLQSTFPLRRGVKAKADMPTREVRVTAGDVKARCFPVALPDDRLLSTVGSFDADTNAIKLTQASSSEGLYAPIVIDWSPKRAVREAEWRTLTVTEDRRKLTPWEAAGHRLRLGDLHLVLFRSLDGSTESRSVLGLHTDKESVIAQFNNKGYVLPIVSVEA